MCADKAQYLKKLHVGDKIILSGLRSHVIFEIMCNLQIIVQT